MVGSGQIVIWEYFFFGGQRAKFIRFFFGFGFQSAMWWSNTNFGGQTAMMVGGQRSTMVMIKEQC